MTFEEAGFKPPYKRLRPGVENSYFMEILGTDDLHCIPLTPVKLDLHPELKDTRSRV